MLYSCWAKLSDLWRQPYEVIKVHNIWINSRRFCYGYGGIRRGHYVTIELIVTAFYTNWFGFERNFSRIDGQLGR